MATRTGEKIGWIGGWTGAFLWVAVLAIVFICRGGAAEGAIGLGVALAAGAIVGFFAPWRWPRTPYWKLMLPAYAALAAAIAWTIHSFGLAALRAEGGSPWLFAAAVPLLLPLATTGRRRWIDGGE
jgi:hypothetical protein